MKNPFHTPFFAVFQNEVLLNSKRVAPYALMILFTSNAVLWWFRGPAVKLGWAMNSDWFITRLILAFSFLLGPPILNAVIMGDSVIKDFRLGVDPLIFSKPVNRAQYLFGKFFGNFFVLVCCLAAFPITQLVLQAFPTSQMIVLPFRVSPYFKHFFFFLVITHLALAAFYFTVGTLTRNSKIVYGLAACFYPLFITYGLFVLRPLPFRWQLMLDPFMLGASLKGNGFLHTAEFLNQYVVRYTADMIANRLVMILLAAVCLAILYVRFKIAERPAKENFSTLNLSTAVEAVYYDSESFLETQVGQSQLPVSPDSAERRMPLVDALPAVSRVNEGVRASFGKLWTAVGVEFRLLRAERSVVVLLPLAILLSVLEVAFYAVAPETSYSVAYATNTAKLLLLFLCGVTVFFTGEAMHRDRELRIEPVLWSMPAPNYLFLLSKFLTTLLLAAALLALVGLAAVAIQLVRGHTPIEILPYMITYAVILIPTVAFVAATTIALNVLLRDKYLAYAVCIGIGGGLFYFYNLGFNHWLYNPTLYQLWTYTDLTATGSGQQRILLHRIYCLAISSFLLALAHLCFQRKAAKGLRLYGPANGAGLTLVVGVASILVAVALGLMIK